MQLEVSSHLIAQLIEQARAADPHECCGILLGQAGKIAAIQPAENIHPDPQTHFEIDPQALIDAHRNARNCGPQVIGYYHSHPNGVAEPSQTDAERTAHDGAIWAIIASGDVTFWRDGEDGFAALPYRIFDR